jgi:hypothetical protein
MIFWLVLKHERIRLTLSLLAFFHVFNFFCFSSDSPVFGALEQLKMHYH